jgi:hypothetical protein
MRRPRLSVILLVLVAASCGDDDGVVPMDSAVDTRAPLDTAVADAAPVDGDVDSGPIRVDLCDPTADPGAYPAPEAWPANAGPGGPARTFADAELYAHCAYLDGGELDVSDHHNLVTMFDGYLLMPWAPEYSQGGLTLWDFSDPCAPVVVGTGYSETMRETHSIGFSSLGGRWAVVNYLELPLLADASGIEFWNLDDPTAPVPVAGLGLPGGVYPDSYARVSLSVAWQVPYVYVAGADNGVWIVDAADPTSPVFVAQYEFEPTLRAGQVQAIGNLLVVSAAEGARTALLDISDPEAPQPIPGGDFEATDGMGTPREAYFTNIEGGFIYYARKEAAGGIFVWDIRNPELPAFAGEILSDGNGGYVFLKEGLAFVGESSFAAIYDVTDLTAITEVTRLDLTGDLDTVTPIGNVAVLSVDDDADDDRGSAVAPYAMDPDTRPPVVTWAYPPDGATDLPPTSRFGVTFDEFVDVKSAWEGSVRLYRTDADPDEGRVDGVVSAQDVFVNFHPFCALEPGTNYTLEIPAGGVVDFNGNAVAETFTATFTTAGP